MSSPGQYGESKPSTLINTSRLIMRFTDGQSSTSLCSPTGRYRSGEPPVMRLEKTTPDTFCLNESLTGVIAGPPSATEPEANFVKASDKRFDSGYESSSRKTRYVPAAARAARSRFSAGPTLPELIIFMRGSSGHSETCSSLVTMKSSQSE